MKKIIPLSLVILLGGCLGQTPPPQSVSYPDSLFVCPDKPDPNEISTDNDLGVFITRQDAVITICKEKLKNVGDLIRANQPGKKDQDNK